MKKLLSFITAGLTAIACVPLSASADNEETAEEIKLPFELTAPENVSLVYLEGNDSENTCEIHYSQNNSMSEWATKNAEPETHDAVVAELNEMGYDDLWINAQIDWSIDSQDDWKCNEYWTTDGYDENFVQHLGDWAYIAQSYSPEISMNEWVFRYMGNIDDPEDSTWYGKHQDGSDYDGWNDVLKEDQYNIIDTGDAKVAKLNLEDHTIYVRVRWLVTCRPLEGDDIKLTSDWSELAALGKDAETAEPLKEGDIAPPAISDLRYMEQEFNGFPVISIKLDVIPELAKQIAQVNGTSGEIRLDVEARLQGTEEWTVLQGDIWIKSGELTFALQNLAEAEKKVEKDAPIELRARYLCMQSGQDDFWSDYSNVLTFGSKAMEVTTQEVTEEEVPTEAPTTAVTTSATTTVTTTTKDKDKCGICGICPQPLGICLFILIAIILVIIGGIIAAVVVMRKKKDETVPESKPAPPAAPENKAPEAAPAQKTESAEAPAAEPEQKNDDGGKENT